MIAVPIGPRVQRFASAAAPSYLAAHGRPAHPRDLLHHACIRHRFLSGIAPPWEFLRDGERVRVDPPGPLVASSKELEVAAALAGLGIVTRSEEHTSELQSLMRISYAVFCLKKKKKRTTTHM